LGKSLVESIIKNRKNILAIIYFSLNYISSKLYILYYKLEIYKTLDIIGNISPYALKRGRKEILNKNQYLNISYAFLSMLVGFIDGDGYICISKTKKKYIKLCLVLSLGIKDLFLLEYMQFHLKLGVINTYPKKGEKHTCKLIINKTDLQDVFFPLLNYHNLFFLTEVRATQYNKALYILHNNIKFYSDIPLNITPYYSILKKSKDYLNLDFFDN
jgi:LAGLIDADG endonuclease